MTDALRATGVRGTVNGLSLEPLSTGGTGMTGQTVRVRLDPGADADDIPATVVAKFAAADAQTRGVIETYDSYAREIRFYQRYASRLPVRTPRYLGAAYDPGSSGQPGPVLRRVVDALPVRTKVWISKNTTKYMRPSKRRYALLIEDLGSSGTIHDLADPPADAQIAAALDVFAAIHAEFWNDPSLAGDDTFDTIITTTPRLYADVARARSIDVARGRYGWLEPAQEALLVEATERFGADIEVLNRPITLVHGDPRTDNLMFDVDGSVIVFDWALAANGHPAWDVGYLLSSCLSDDRLGSLAPLVAGYEAALASHGVDVDGDDLRAGVDAAYRANAVQQLLALAVLDGTDELTGAEMADLWLPRILAGLGHEWG